MTNKRSSFLITVAVGAAFLSLFLRPALGAQPAIVEQDNVEVRSGPGASHPVIEKLPKGEGIAVSNVPTEGYYKVRTQKGAVGWVSADSLSLHKEGLVPVQDAQQPGGNENQIKRLRKPVTKPMLLAISGGASTFACADINDLIGKKAVQYGYQFGAEVSYFVSPVFGLSLHFEKAAASVRISETSGAQRTFDIALSSMPVMLGGKVRFLRTKNFFSHFSVYGGVGVQTKLTSTLQGVDNGVTEFKGNATGGIAKVDLHWQVSNLFAIFAETGYRYLRTSAISADPAGQGNDLFQKDSALVPIRLDYSGFVGSAGIALMF